jgi:hypothetical protein
MKIANSRLDRPLKNRAGQPCDVQGIKHNKNKEIKSKSKSNKEQEQEQ